MSAKPFTVTDEVERQVSAACAIYDLLGDPMSPGEVAELRHTLTAHATGQCGCPLHRPRCEDSTNGDRPVAE